MQHPDPRNHHRPPRARGRPPSPEAAARGPAPIARAPRAAGATRPAETPRPPREAGAQRTVHGSEVRLRTAPPPPLIDLLRPGEGFARPDPTLRRPRAGPGRRRGGTGPPGRGSGPGASPPRARARPGRTTTGPPDRGSGPGARTAWPMAAWRTRRDLRPPAAPVEQQSHVPPGVHAPGTIRSGTRDGPPRARGEAMPRRRARGEAPARRHEPVTPPPTRALRPSLRAGTGEDSPRSDRGEARVTGRSRHRSAASARRPHPAVRVDRPRAVPRDPRTFME